MSSGSSLSHGSSRLKVPLPTRHIHCKAFVVLGERHYTRSVRYTHLSLISLRFCIASFHLHSEINSPHDDLCYFSNALALITIATEPQTSPFAHCRNNVLTATVTYTAGQKFETSLSASSLHRRQFNYICLCAIVW